jgi:hypothetical protein
VIAHGMTIIKNELERNLGSFGGNSPHAELGNVAEVSAGSQGNGQGRNRVLMSLVNIQEERTLRNGQTYVRDDASLRVRHENPPIVLNLAMLVAATHTDYDDALRALSRALLFFQSRTVFTHENVHPGSMTAGAPVNDRDRLAEFRMVVSLWSPSMEEINDMWGMLGGKQFPFALYAVRALELRSGAALRESGLITEVVQDYAHARGAS